MIDTTIKQPSPTLYFGLQSDPAIFINRLDQLGVSYLQARTDSGGIGKLARLDDVYFDEYNETMNSPTSGWIVSLQRLLALNATKNDSTDGAMSGFDFEFANRPCGCSIYASPAFSDMNGYHALLESFFDTPEPRSQLDSWREKMAPLDYHCEECAEAGIQRAKHAHKHPLFLVAQSIVANQTKVFARMQSTHADLTASFTPENVRLDGGIISLVDRASTIVSLNLKNIHTTIINKKTVDGELVAALTCHNSLGLPGIQITVENPDTTSEWISAF